VTKYNAQFKLEVIQSYLKTGSQYQTAKLYGVNTSDVRRWTLVYQHHGPASLQKQVNQRRSVKHKLEILEYIRVHGISARQAAAQFNIPSPSTIALWQRLYNEGGIAALQSAPIGRRPMPKINKTILQKSLTELTAAELQRRLEYVEAENAYLKKLRALVQEKNLANRKQPK
jgi:transposase